METSSSNSAANPSPESVKLFVGGIKENFKEEEIRDYFTKFGEVKEVVVVKDRVTGNVRGFGFVEFSDPNSAERALNEKVHAIGDRKVDVKRARPRTEQRRNHQSPHYQYSTLSDHENRGLNNHAAHSYCYNENPTRLKKIFVGGLSSSITEDEFKSYFEKFGRITDTVIMYDSSTHRPRGFGFITFESVEAVNYVLQNKFHELDNKTVEVKLAVPRDSSNQNFSDPNGGIGVGRGPAFSYQQRGYYSPNNPRCGLLPSFAPPVPGFFYGTAGYGGGYGIGPYGGISYGSPYAARSPWNGPGMTGARRSAVPYGNASMYPGYFNLALGGYAGMGADGYRGFTWSDNDKLNQSDDDVRLTNHTMGTDDVGNEKLDIQKDA